MPVNVFLIEHPEGLCLFDAGQTALAARPCYFPRWYPFFRLSRFELTPEDEAAAQLERAGIAPCAVRWVVLSHLHTDHVGGLGSFDHAEVLVSRCEWERAGGFAGRLRGYLPQYWPTAIQPELIDFTGDPIGPFLGSRSLTGDGQLVLVPIPGHTPGHMGLIVWSDPGGYLLAGDAVLSAAELPRRAPSLADFCSREQLVFLAAHDPDAAVVLACGPAERSLSHEPVDPL